MVLLQRWLDPGRSRFRWLEGCGHGMTIEAAWQQLAQLSVEALRDRA
jgi:hypothetical protein